MDVVFLLLYSHVYRYFHELFKDKALERMSISFIICLGLMPCLDSRRLNEFHSASEVFCPCSALNYLN